MHECGLDHYLTKGFSLQSVFFITPVCLAVEKTSKSSSAAYFRRFSFDSCRFCWHAHRSDRWYMVTKCAYAVNRFFSVCFCASLFCFFVCFFLTRLTDHSAVGNPVRYLKSFATLSVSGIPEISLILGYGFILFGVVPQFSADVVLIVHLGSTWI